MIWQKYEFLNKIYSFFNDNLNKFSNLFFIFHNIATASKISFNISFLKYFIICVHMGCLLSFMFVLYTFILFAFSFLFNKIGDFSSVCLMAVHWYLNWMSSRRWSWKITIYAHFFQINFMFYIMITRL